MRRIVEWPALAVVLAIAAAARLWYLSAGVPHAVGIDEPLVVDHAVRILRTGDWNPHIFNYPTLVIYLHAALDIVRFLWGAVNGEWASLDAFNIAAVYKTGRAAAALIGVATVWLTYRLGVEVASAPVGLLGAALLAVRPMHVRESHYVLTDVPMTALVTLALWLTVRAGAKRTTRAYVAAGVACGLAAAAKYTGGAAFVAVAVASIVHQRTAADRGLKVGAAAAAAAIAFLIAAPYTILDLPSFLDGFASLSAHYGASRAGDPSWLLYAKHLSLDSTLGLALAVAALPIVLLRRDTAIRWLPVIAFAAAYFYLLSSHTHVFARYALPLLPVASLLAATAVLAALGAAARVPALSSPLRQGVLLAAAIAIVLYAPAIGSVRWLGALKRVDTRTMAAEWLTANAPRGARVAVENSGPTYLDAAGYLVVPNELMTGRPIDWYRGRADYLVISAGDLARYGDYLSAGPTVFQVSPTPQRWGPPIRIVSLRGGAAGTGR